MSSSLASWMMERSRVDAVLERLRRDCEAGRGMGDHEGGLCALQRACLRELIELDRRRLAADLAGMRRAATRAGGYLVAILLELETEAADAEGDRGVLD